MKAKLTHEELLAEAASRGFASHGIDVEAWVADVLSSHPGFRGHEPVTQTASPQVQVPVPISVQTAEPAPAQPVIVEVRYPDPPVVVVKQPYSLPMLGIIIIVAVLLTLFLFAGPAKAQVGGIILRVQNAGTTIKTWAAGLAVLNCLGGLTCTASGNVVSIDSTSPATFSIVDEFIQETNAGSGNSPFFKTYQAAGSSGFAAADCTHRIGCVTYQTGATAASFIALMTSVPGTVGVTPSAFWASTDTATLTIDLQLNTTTAEQLYLGWATTTCCVVPTAYFSIRFDTVAGDANWVCATANGAGATTAAIPGAVVNTAFHRFFIKKTGVNAGSCSMDNGANSSTLTLAVTGQSEVGIELNNPPAANKGYNIDRMALTGSFAR